MEVASKEPRVRHPQRLVAGAQEGRSWRFQAQRDDFRFALHHPDIALSLLDHSLPLSLSLAGEGVCRGWLLGLRVEWKTLSASREEPEHSCWSLVVRFSARFPPIGIAWQLDVNSQTYGQELLVQTHLRPLSRVWLNFWLGFSQSLWQETIYALCGNLGRAAERLSHDPPAELLGLLPTSEQRERLRKHLETRTRISPSVVLESPRSMTLLSILEAGEQTLIRFHTNAPRPRRGQEVLRISPEERGRLMSSFEKLARAGSAFSTLRGTQERHAVGRDLHERLIQLGRKLYGLYIPKDTHGYLTSLLDAHPQGPFRIEIEGGACALPWELLHNGEDFLALLLPLARTPTEATEAAQTFGPVQRVLLIVPESDLDEALVETQAIHDVLTEDIAIDVEILSGQEATKEKIIHTLQTGGFDAIHYSGHSHHDPELASASHLVLNQGRKLRAEELRRLIRECGLKFIFLNSCESGSAMGHSHVALAGLADAFVQSGVPCVIGMRWPVSDRGARELALTFYQALAKLGDPAEALRKARLAVGTAFDWEDPAWAAPLMYLS